MPRVVRWFRAVLPLLSAGLVLGAASAGSGSDDGRDAADRGRVILAQKLFIRGEAARAESVLCMVVDPDSMRPIAWLALNQIGQLRFREKNYRGAIAALQRRERLDPNDGEALFYMGLSYRELGEKSRALPGLRRAAMLRPADPGMAFWLAVTLLESDRKEEARAAFEQCVAADSTGRYADAAFRQLGFLYQALGWKEQARDAFERGHVLEGSRRQVIDSPIMPPVSWPRKGSSPP